MKHFLYFFLKLFCIVFLGLAIASYFKNKELLSLLGSIAIYNIGFEIFLISKKKKIELEVKSLFEGNFSSISIWPIYILIFIFVTLGLLQNCNLLNFSKNNNLILCLTLGLHLIYKNERGYESVLKSEKAKSEFIKRYGEEEFNKMKKESDKIFKETEEKIERFLNKRDH